MAGFAALFRRAREQLGMSIRAAADAMGVTPRTVERWEAAQVAPTTAVRDAIVEAFAGADAETWSAIVRALDLPLPMLLLKYPAHAPPPTVVMVPAPAPPPTAPPPPRPDPRAVLDGVLRACAEDLDVSPRRVRLVVAAVLADVERLGLSAGEARELVLARKVQG